MGGLKLVRSRGGRAPARPPLSDGRGDHQGRGDNQGRGDQQRPPRSSVSGVGVRRALRGGRGGSQRDGRRLARSWGDNQGRRLARSWVGRERTFAYGRGPAEQRRHYLGLLSDAYANATAGVAREMAREMAAREVVAREMAAREVAASGGPLRRAGGGAARRAGGRRGGEGVITSGMRLLVMGNGGCRRQQREHWGEVRWLPPLPTCRLTRRG